MSYGDTDCNYEHMAAFDFGTQYNVTIFFEDSDEERSPIVNSDKKRCSNRNEANNVINIDKNEIPIEQRCLTSNNIVNGEIRHKKMACKRKSDHIINAVAKKQFMEVTCSNTMESGNKKENLQNNSAINFKKHSVRNVSQIKDTPVLNNHRDASTICEKKNNETENMNTCIMHLLQSVIEHLVYSIEVHNRHNRVRSDKNSTTATIWHSKKLLLRAKCHFFGLSYSTVVTILLPQQNNNSFINFFLNKALKFASEKNIMCTYSQLKSVYTEMIDWVQKKKDHLNRLRLNLETSSRSNHNDNNSFEVQAQTSELKKLLNNQASNSNIQNNVPYIEFRNISTAESSSRTNPVTGHHQQQCHYPTNTGKNYYAITEKNGYHYQSQVGTTIREINGPVLHKHFYPQNNTIPQYECNVRRQDQLILDKSKQDLYNRPLLLKPSPPYTNCTNKDYSQFTNLQNPTLVPSIQIENPRSVSADSGIMSPVNFDQAPDDMNIIFQKPQMSFITHTTSLHKETSYEACRLCGKITRDVCLGCNKAYYCSYKCQERDWQHHRHFCKNS